jgi:5-deoxy-glucuronate isomerase
MSLVKKYQNKNGLTNVVSEGESGLKKVMFDLLKLKSGEFYDGDTETKETTFIILSGTCSFIGNDFNYDKIGIRKDVFSGKPSSVYLPINTTYKITAITDVEIGICAAHSKLQSAPVLILPEDVTEVNLGISDWARKAYFIVDQKINSQHLFIGETFLPLGNWAFPPHRHDFDNYPEEVDMDEVYHFRINPSTGFAIQISYTDDKLRDDAYMMRNGDTVLIPNGYHPVAASPADSVYFLWMMAGEKRFFISRPDDNYSWVNNQKTS